MAIDLGNFGRNVASGGLSQPIAQPNPLGASLQVLSQYTEQKAMLNEESMRARAANTSIDYQNHLNTIHEQVKDGMRSGDILPENAAKAFKEKASEAREALLSTLPPQEQRILSPVLTGYALRGVGQTEQNQLSFVQDGIHAQLSESLSGLDKLSLSNPDSAIQQAKLVLDNQGPKAGLSQEQIATTFDQFASKTQYQTTSLGIQSGTSIGDLKKQRKSFEDPNVLPYLNAQHRTALMNQTDSRIRELDTQHKLNQAEAMGGAREIASFYLQAADNGQPVSPDLQLAAQHAKSVLGSTPAGKLVADRIDGAMAAYDQVSRLYGMSFASQEAKTAELYSLVTKQADLHQAAQLQQVADRVASAQQRNQAIYKTDPFAYYEKITGNPVAPLDLNADLSGQLAERSKIGAQLSGVTGQPAGLLRPQEAAAIKAHLDTLPVDAQLNLLASIQQAAPTTAKYTMAQIGAQKPIYGAVGLLASDPQTRPAATLIARGNQLEGAGVNDKAIKLAPGFDQLIQQKWSKEMGGFFQGNAQASSSALSFARAAYMALAERDGKNYLGDEGLNNARWKEAVKVATGGVREFNGYPTIPPYGMDQKTFESKANGALSATFATVADPSKKRDLISDSKLVLGSKDGEYLVLHSNDVIGSVIIQK